MRRVPSLFAVLLAAGLAPAGAETVPPPSMRSLPAGGVSVESAALLMSGQEGGEIALGVVALPIRADEGGTRILVRLRLQGPSLLAGQTRDTLRVEASLYVLDAGNGVQASLLETVEVDLPALRSSVEQSGIDLLGSMRLKPGKYTLRMLARNLETGRLAVRSVTLPVPELADLDPSPPLSPPPAQDPRVTVRSSTLGPFDPPSFPEDPTVAGTRAAAPALEAQSAPAPSPLLATAEGRKLRAAASAAYREALMQLAAGQEAEALAAVAALEDSILLRSDMPVRPEDLAEIELDAASGVAKIDPESLVPLLHFQRRLHETAAGRGRRQGSSMAREVGLRLLELYRQGGRAALARDFGLIFADTLLRAGVRSRAGPLFQRVLADDPGNELALLELAVDSDRRGAREQALGYVEELLRGQPNHSEARLRRAVILERLGRRKEAIEGFRAFVQDELAGWRLRLAYQELCRALIAAGMPVERTLREGLERLPGDEKLTLLLAANLERSGQRSQAREVMAGFKPEGSDGGGTARHRYNGLPDELIEALRTELDREAAAHLATLGAALERTGK